MPAKRITTVRTRRVKGIEEVTHLGEAQRSAVRWMTVRDLEDAYLDMWKEYCGRAAGSTRLPSPSGRGIEGEGSI